MFDALRKMIFPIIIIVLFFFVAMIILQWGMGMSSRQSHVDRNVAGVINGEEVSWQEYTRIYNNLYQAEMAKLDEDQQDQELSDEKVDELQEQAWNQVLGDRLMKQEMAKYDIVVTDEEIYGYLRSAPPAELQSMPYFQTDGKFDYSKYVSSMADPQMASYWASLEPMLRSDIRKMKLQEMIIQAAHISEDEIKEFYKEATERVKVGLVNVGFARFSAPPPQSTDEEYQQYYESHKEDYTIGERASLGLCMLEKQPGRADWERSYEQAKEIYDSLLAGANFKALAADLSEDVASARDSGNLGWFPAGRMVSEFDRVAFSMEKGEISEPVRTQFGWHIIKHEGYRDTVNAKKEPVREAHCSHILIKSYPSTETLDQLYQRLVDFRAAAVEKGFFVAAEELDMPATTTGLFERDASIPNLGRNKAASNFAFEADLGTISDVQESDAAFYVLEAAKREPAGYAEYDLVKDRVRMALQKEKVQALCRDTANAIWDAIQNGTDIKTAAKKYGEEYETPAEFGRAAYVRGLGRAPEPIGAAFGLKAPHEITPPVEFDQGVAIIELLERTSFDVTQYTEKRDSVRTAVLTAKRQETFARWFQHLMETSEIVNNTQRVSSESEYM